jgi:hypothetical protein
LIWAGSVDSFHFETRGRPGHAIEGKYPELEASYLADIQRVGDHGRFFQQEEFAGIENFR